MEPSAREPGTDERLMTPSLLASISSKTLALALRVLSSMTDMSPWATLLRLAGSMVVSHCATSVGLASRSAASIRVHPPPSATKPCCRTTA
jgi:hypothetical protein